MGRRAARVALLLFAGCASGQPARADGVEARVQHVLDDYLAQRGEVESVSGVSIDISLGGSRPDIVAFAGNDGLAGKPITADTLFQIGSNTKHFTAALILKLEADGKLGIGQTVGDWLPQYPAWRDVTIRSLLNMTSGIPNYSETVEVGAAIAADIHHQFEPRELVASVDPGAGRHLPPNTGWFYSNTNNILAEMVIEKASGLSYKDALETLLFRPLRLGDTFYPDRATPAAVVDRLPRGLYENKACLLYQPTPCARSTLEPLVGRDMRASNLSWAGAAGAIVSTPRDLKTWIRAMFSARVFPEKQLEEMEAIVSQATGLQIQDVTAADPKGFGLDVGRVYVSEDAGSVWFYQGTTLGFRATFAYWPQYDLVITAATNSQPPDGQDQFNARVVIAAFDALRDAKAIERVHQR